MSILQLFYRFYKSVSTFLFLLSIDYLLKILRYSINKICIVKKNQNRSHDSLFFIFCHKKSFSPVIESTTELTTLIKQIKPCFEGTEQIPAQNSKKTHDEQTEPSNTHLSYQTYNMNHENRGTAIIFNHEWFEDINKYPVRNGTNVDCDTLKKTFEMLGFEVKIFNNKKLHEIEEELQKSK